MAWDPAAKVLGIVRYRGGGDVKAVLASILEGGIGMLEVTLDTPGALTAIERFADAGAVIGAGTVLTPDDVAAAADAGAAFLVAPVVSDIVVSAARDRGVDVVPGALTPTEVARAAELGAAAVKLFPASLGGPRYLRSLRGPFPDVPLVPTGGVAVDEVPAYLAAGASCVGLGGELVGRTAPRDAAGFAEIRERAAAAVAAAAAAEAPG
jgi:2-dehydro-3-deoxyphosphogluconate aldolase / (4S)-4-hydroxy-2-oxoglutarate aldolase